MSGHELREDVESTFRELRGLIEGTKPAAPPEDEDEGPESPAIPEPETNVPRASIPSPEVTELSEEDETYPGSRHVRRSVLEASEDAEDDPDEDVVWDESPRLYSVRGREVELFTISALSQALRRKPVTLRKWEDKGYFPPARYRGPGPEGKQPRLYTRAQIEGAVAIAKEEGLMNPSKKLRIDQTRFPERARRLFAALEQRSQM